VGALLLASHPHPGWQPIPTLVLPLKGRESTGAVTRIAATSTPSLRLKGSESTGVAAPLRARSPLALPLSGGKAARARDLSQTSIGATYPVISR
jgi:hypothetical protein